MNGVKHFTENLSGTDYVCGDIHGYFDKLEEELALIGFDESKDRLFSTGDLVDRGPQSTDCIDWLAKPWFHAVRGNHEQMAMDFVAGYSDHYYSYNGGQWMIDLPKSRGKMFAQAFTDLPIAIDIKVGNKLYGVVHAECPTKSWLELEEVFGGRNSDGYTSAAMWSRDKFNSGNQDMIEGVDLVYVGHTPLKEITVMGNVIYIDTGACFGGKLTILEIY